MPLAIQVMPALLIVLYGAMVLVVLFRLLCVPGAFRGMLAAPGQSRPSPERVQLLVLSLGGMGGYLFTVLSSPDLAHLDRLPDVPEWLLPLLAGSHTTYLAGKAVRTLRS